MNEDAQTVADAEVHTTQAETPTIDLSALAGKFPAKSLLEEALERFSKLAVQMLDPHGKWTYIADADEECIRALNIMLHHGLIYQGEAEVEGRNVLVYRLQEDLIAD